MVEYTRTLIRLFVRDKKAVTAIEYALVAALISVIIIKSVITTGHNVSSTFSTIAAEL
jgi:pilus assembly protein Flp/PilA